MAGNARSAYMNASVATATPARLLVMLYDRLLLDVQRALLAQREGRHTDASSQLLHAQEIVLELRTTLQVEAWEGGPRLAALYDWIRSQLVEANVRRDPAPTEACLPIVDELATSWRQAAMATTASA